MSFKEYIHKLQWGKSCGFDGLFAEHLLYSGDKLPIMLTMCLNACLSHGFLPNMMIKSIIVPVIKNKTGDVSDKSNYRPIALASVVSKLVKMALFMENWIMSKNKW